MKNFSYKIFIFLIIFYSIQIQAAVVYTQGSNATQLATQIQGVGITITNPVITHGASSQRGIFSNGINGANLEVDEGILLTTMSVTESFTTNSSYNTSLNPSGTYSDTDLTGIDSAAIYNPIIFEFDVTLDANTRLLLIDYQFASEEYNEFAGTRFNDSFGFFVSGGDLPANTVYNIARVVDNNTYVTINSINNYDTVTVNNVNNGSPGIYAASYPATGNVNYNNSAYFINNDQNNNGGTSPIIVEYDGLTHKLHATLDNLTPGQTYHFKMAIADTGDTQWNTGVFVNKINGLREPSICYDYAYKQNDQYITSEYNATIGPQVAATVSTSSPLEVAMYFKNISASEILATNVKLNILDINASNQATYSLESVFATNANSITKNHIPDNTLGMSVSDKELLNIPVNSFNSLDYFYTYFSINPTVTNLNLPIVARLNYDLIIPLSATENVAVPRSSLINSVIPLCGNSGFTYVPVHGIFNIIENGLNTSNLIYNLNTQITHRNADVSVMSMDPVNLDTPKALSTIVTVDMIDLQSFHDTTASCDEYNNSISDRISVILNNSTTALLDTSANSNFFQQARENAAFRVSYNVTNDGNESLIQLQANGANYQILNFTQLVQNIGTCQQTVEAPAGNSGKTTSTDQVAVACGNAGNQGISAQLLQACMECLYGYNTKFVCSRDNFAIRPEAFLINIDDQNQTNVANRNRITNNYSGVITPNTARVNMASGYNYNLEINATNHIDNNSALGYTTGIDVNYTWSPRSGQIVAGCNDITDKVSAVNLSNGSLDINSSVSQVGDYSLSLNDTTWTHVDYDPSFMSHHTGAYFLAGTDCVQNSSFTNTTASNDHLNGCNISSNHTNNSNNLKYIDFNVSFHPYKFDVSNITPTVGLNYVAITAPSYIYMSDISKDENMSYHLNGTVVPEGENNTPLNNFVDQCYAVPLDINVSQSDTLLSDTNGNPVVYQARFFDINTSSNNVMNTLTIDSNKTNSLNNVNITTNASHFIKNFNGTIDTRLNLNYYRENNTTVNPIQIFFNQYKVNCNNGLDCNMNANLKTDYQPTGTQDLNNSIGIKHYYGRTHTPRYRFNSNHGTALIYYEVFCNGAGCNTALLPNGTTSKTMDDPRWFTNTIHTTASGMAQTINQRGFAVGAGPVRGISATLTTPASTTLSYHDSATKGYPYKTTMESNASSWLIYNKYNANATKNEFEVEFTRDSGAWAGIHETNTETDSNGTQRTNRRTMW